eukprot:14351507-Ditylum_brightwellii.AAC.1
MEDTNSLATDKQVRKASTLHHSIFHSNHLLFNTSLQDHLNSLQDAQPPSGQTQDWSHTDTE